MDEPSKLSVILFKLDLYVLSGWAFCGFTICKYIGAAWLADWFIKFLPLTAQVQALEELIESVERAREKQDRKIARKYDK